ncbi:Fe(3+) ABC transporter substrate-binding protein [Tenacibaculum finnmarkense]|uniref:Fe(3+) ABC transporter substrate-binding protein n=1 Tax=Tenacibaculum finnmarkense TaxID=2781243 RepID=UPI001E5EA11E|nr:Fe(3+) ABC transporter substrate-binding protein [Tenacibaculum finnmarkense]MCD8443940.1 Fe(3+) ABC transporter substrate-binding protein [Tenacibaculum finnmarkense genomovar ulcerans]MCG8236454.1 Fe(3+) ABC transporter substrate-binding protein [Tenacibaculum finnmarkense genomovar ulcerans]MCG8750309.1 Fe(3+) ABC transporter substrate-binding protein [Tenacibaculum finnmarkense]MCG8754783.1 Fe(3+) ABC transporter substrate-binding protein [Tenacibaculum finnmarkense]MCG8782963.1 Fe(3+) 
MKNIVAILMITALFSSCKNDQKKAEKAAAKQQEVNVYTHRHYKADQELFAKFEKQTGIKVNVTNAKADELMQKMTIEGAQSPADVLITVDAGRLVRAKKKGLLQSASSSILEKIIPTHLKDADNNWFSLTKRARIMVYNPEKVSPEDLSTYQALTDDKWKNKVLIRSSGNIYNQSLLASIIANNGEEKAAEWAKGIVANMARSPKGNDRDQVKAVVAGEGDVAIVNTYYIGKLLNSKNPDEVNAAKGIKLFFPNQNGSGTHINVSGAGVAKYAPNKANAIKFIEFLVSKESQEVFAKANYEYPVNQEVVPSDLLKSWGTFKEDKLSLTKLGENNKKAVLIFDKAQWK